LNDLLLDARQICKYQHVFQSFPAKSLHLPNIHSEVRYRTIAYVRSQDFFDKGAMTAAQLIA